MIGVDISALNIHWADFGFGFGWVNEGASSTSRYLGLSIDTFSEFEGLYYYYDNVRRSASWSGYISEFVTRKL